MSMISATQKESLGTNDVFALCSFSVLEDFRRLLVDGLAHQDLVALRSGKRTVDLVAQSRRLVGRVARLNVFDRHLLEVSGRPGGLIGLFARGQRHAAH